jgi:hypothetical protein
MDTGDIVDITTPFCARRNIEGRICKELEGLIDGGWRIYAIIPVDCLGKRRFMVANEDGIMPRWR